MLIPEGSLWFLWAFSLCAAYALIVFCLGAIWLVRERARLCAGNSSDGMSRRDAWWGSFAYTSLYFAVVVLTVVGWVGVWHQQERLPLDNFTARLFFNQDERNALRAERAARVDRARAVSTMTLVCLSETARGWSEETRALALEEAGFPNAPAVPTAIPGCYSAQGDAR